jgi:hypothetical protein
MANTVIQLKKSAIPGAEPTWIQLANGEIALNFADGKIFYKNSTTNAIANIRLTEVGGGGNYFGTVNADGTLLVSDTPGDVVTLIAGAGITIIGDAAGDNVTFSTAAFDQANTALTTGQSGFYQANLAFAAGNTAPFAFATANLAFAQANTALTTGQSGFYQANLAFSAGNTAPFAFATANAAFAKANVAPFAFATANLAFAAGNTAPFAFATANAAFAQANTSNNITVGNTPSAGGVYTTRSYRTKLNFVAGTNITINVDDDSAGDRANVTITSSGGPGGGGGTYANVSDTVPANPSPGQMWWNSANGNMFVYYNDGTSSQWVQTGGAEVANVINSNATIIGNLYILGSITDQFGNLRDLPVKDQTGAEYTLTTNDVGRVVQISANCIIPNTVFTQGQAITIVNNSSASQNIVNTNATMVYLAGSASVGTRVLAQRGLATLLCTAANTFYISGAGLT